MPPKLTGGTLSQYDRLRMRVESLEESRREHNGRMRRLEEDWREFPQVVAEHVSNKVIIPALVKGLMSAIEMPPTLQRQEGDRLSIDRIESKRGKGFKD